MSQTNPIDRLYDALTHGDIDAVRASYTPDARIWHSFDGEVQDVDTAVKALAGLVAHTSERGIEDVTREPIAGGFLQRHVFVMRTPAGGRKAWPICLVVRVEDGRIAQLEEYMDRAGSFAPPEGPVKTPGLTPAA